MSILSINSPTISNKSTDKFLFFRQEFCFTDDVCENGEGHTRYTSRPYDVRSGNRGVATRVNSHLRLTRVMLCFSLDSTGTDNAESR